LTDTLIAILKLVPAIVDLVKSAEVAFPGSGTGPAKLDFVVSVLATVEEIPTDPGGTVLKLINLVAAKLFPHK
jgi:hypothetical protein